MKYAFTATYRLRQPLRRARGGPPAAGTRPAARAQSSDRPWNHSPRSRVNMNPGCTTVNAAEPLARDCDELAVERLDPQLLQVACTATPLLEPEQVLLRVRELENVERAGREVGVPERGAAARHHRRLFGRDPVAVQLAAQERNPVLELVPDLAEERARAATAPRCAPPGAGFARSRPHGCARRASRWTAEATSRVERAFMSGDVSRPSYPPLRPHAHRALHQAPHPRAVRRPRGRARRPRRGGRRGHPRGREGAAGA